jgi:hypothetical protein
MHINNKHHVQNADIPIINVNFTLLLLLLWFTKLKYTRV